MPLPPPRGVTVRVVYDPDPVAQADALIAVAESAARRASAPRRDLPVLPPAADGPAPTGASRPQPPPGGPPATPTRTAAADRARVHPGWLVRPTAARQNGYATPPAAANGAAESGDYPQTNGGNGDGAGAQS